MCEIYHCFGILWKNSTLNSTIRALNKFIQYKTGNFVPSFVLCVLCSWYCCGFWITMELRLLVKDSIPNVGAARGCSTNTVVINLLREEPRYHPINDASQVWITSPMWNEEQGGKVEMGLPFILGPKSKCVTMWNNT